jgi:Macrocin-O-methyltransferase (TylF)
MQDYLPTFPNLSNVVRNGRRVYEGYQRGWGLEFGGLKEAITNDPDYKDALKYAAGRSVVTVERMMNLFMIIKFYMPALPFGHIIEFGSYRGGSAFFMAALAERFLPGAQVYGLDSFGGMPRTDGAIDLHSHGDFASTNFDEVMQAKEKFGFSNVHFVKGIVSGYGTGRACGSSSYRVGACRLRYI